MIGDMDQSVEIFTTTFTSDGMGGSDRTITSGGNYFAKVSHVAGEEREHAGRNADKISVSFTMHNFEGFPVSTTSFIDWAGQRFDVVDREYEGPQRLRVTFKTVAGESIEST